MQGCPTLQTIQDCLQFTNGRVFLVAFSLNEEHRNGDGRQVSRGVSHDVMPMAREDVEDRTAHFGPVLAGQSERDNLCAHRTPAKEERQVRQQGLRRLHRSRGRRQEDAQGVDVLNRIHRTALTVGVVVAERCNTVPGEGVSQLDHQGPVDRCPGPRAQNQQRKRVVRRDQNGRDFRPVWRREQLVFSCRHLLPSRVQRGDAEDDGEGLAVDHHALDGGDVHVGRDGVVLVAPVALQRAEVGVAGQLDLVATRGVLVR